MTRSSPPPAFVGRRDELATFATAVADARSGLPSVLLVSGEAGIGKTTLVAEGARRSQASLFMGRSSHVGGNLIPLAPIADLMRQVRRSGSGPSVETDLLAASIHRRATAPRSLETEPDPGSIFAEMLNLLGTLGADGPVVVGIEDLHWADDGTWDVFEFLARNLVDEHVVLVGTHRSDGANTNPSHRRRLAELSRLPSAHLLHLVGLDSGDVAARVADLIGAPATPTLVESIVDRGHGNPFFTEELVAAHLAGDTIPMVLSDLISADIAELDGPTRSVLGAVAVIGRETTHDLLVRVADLDHDDVEAAVRSALGARMLVAENDAYGFRHALIGEVVYADLLPPQRVRLHLRVADAIEQEPPGVRARADRAGELAIHLDRAGDPGPAFAALLVAADAAEPVAPGVAFGQLERALGLWDLAGDHAAGERRSDRLWQAADLADATTGSMRAVDLAQAAIALAPPRQGAAWGHERLGRYLWTAGRLEESQTEFELAASLLGDDDGPQAARVFAGLGQAEFMAGRYESADRLSRAAMQLISAFDTDPLAWVLARHVQGSVRNHLGDPESGIALCRDAFLAAPTAHTRGTTAFLYAVVLLSAGRTQEAVDTAMDAVAECRRAGLDHSLGTMTDTVAADGLIRLGKWHEAAALLATRSSDEDTVPLGSLRLARSRAMLAARQDDRDRALALLAVARTHPADGMHLSFLDTGSADVHLILGNWTEAAEDAERGWAANPPAVLLWSARFAMLSIEAAVEQALDAIASQQPVDLTRTITRLQARLDLVRNEAERRTDPRLGRDTVAHLAHAAASLTRLTRSDPEAWREASQRWSELGDRWWTVVAQIREADAAASAGKASRAAEALREAQRNADELQAAPLLRQIAALSRRTRISLEEPTRVRLEESSISQLGLTPREVQVLTLVSGGRTNREIGAELFVNEKTASVHVSNIMRKLGVASRVDAAAIAQRLGTD